MHKYGAFGEASLSAIRPSGWLLRWLQTQSAGLTGHMEAAAHPFDRNWWGCPDSYDDAAAKPWGWAAFEQTGYWVDGAIRCAYLIGDQPLADKARQQCDYVLNHPAADGTLGPQWLQRGPMRFRWPQVVFSRALMACHSATGDGRIVSSLQTHFLAERGTWDRDLWSNAVYLGDREVCNVEPMLWTYDRCGDERLLREAVRVYAEYNHRWAGTDCTLDVMLSDKRGTEHGVTYNELGKLGAVMYLRTGDERQLKATVNAFAKLDRDQMLVDGVPSSAEDLRGKDPLDSHETCVIADHTWALGYLLMATGEAQYADRIERACFNAGLGAVRKDFRGLQYFSCPNQVLATGNSNHNEFSRGYAWMSYRPNPGTECCPGDVHRTMPNYAARMWLLDRRGGPVAALYGPSSFAFSAPQGGQAVTVHEQTDYPFSEEIAFRFETAGDVRFPFTFRIPGWAAGAKAWVNDEPVDADLRAGSFVTLERVFANGDCVRVMLPMALKLGHWPLGGVSIERGPLVFALRIAEDWRVDKDDKRSTPQFPAWNLYPASTWNYALALDARTLAQRVRVVTQPMTDGPWTIAAAPVMLDVPARRVVDWDLVRRASVETYHGGESRMAWDTLHGDFVMTPQLPDPTTLPERLAPEVETVTLVPYGCTHLRITVFPAATVR